MNNRFDPLPILAQLKDFQRASVDHAFGRMYDEGAGRFLVADEVGLGKTMVARGVIAKAIDRLWNDIERIDVIYICSNSSIAQQNIRRLNVMPEQGFSFSSRMTMIARQSAKLEGNKVNFVSFTPGTSFDLKSSTGASGERVLLYWILRSLWGDAALDEPGATRTLKCSVGEENWPKYLAWGELKPAEIDPELLEGFASDLVDLDARQRFSAIAPAFADPATSESSEVRHLRDELVGQLRQRLAKRCVRSLEPDLVVLDEFQRFRHLLSGDDPAAELASELFDFEDNKTLLLSATPYKMFTRGDDADDNHHQDFIETVRQLFNGQPNRFEAAMAEFRSAILDVQHRSVLELAQLRQAVEVELSKVMVRTERLGAGDDRNGMLIEVPASAPLRTEDVESYVGLERVATAAGAQSTMEYWKSVPSFVNFCDGYKIDDQLKAALEADATDAYDALAQLNGRVDWNSWRSFERLPPDNGRYRVLEEQTVDSGAWRMLWLAPSLPYYELAGPWSGKSADFTKRLIFSRWGGVPKAVSSLLSYEVERRLFGLRPEPMDNTSADRVSIRGLLPFRRDPLGRPGSMNSFALIYPCITLAEMGDPLSIARHKGSLVELTELREIVAERISEALSTLNVETDESVHGDDLRWYWAAPLLLDSANSHAPWVRNGRWTNQWWSGGSTTDESEETGHEILDEHIELATAASRGEIALGKQPSDLVDVLVDYALGSPATVALRSFNHVLGTEVSLRYRFRGACRAGWAFRSLFNRPDVNSLVRSADWGQDYWRTAQQYCVTGCLSAVLDEYVHVLRESLGLFTITNEADDMAELASALEEAVTLHTPSLVARDHLGESVDAPRFRTRYAMRFGNERAETESSTVTATHLRRAFNSPFWPFVLSSTSVGQEGLDFHSYSHAIVHWNLPSNPVDLEQREGRVHRFKGHAVRRNLANANVEGALASDGDPWAAMFNAAAANRGPEENELVPYWIYPGSSKIERHVPILPMSREVGQLARLKRDVARYRLVFGQPRQDDLLEYLGEVPLEKLAELRIDLSPSQTNSASTQPSPTVTAGIYLQVEQSPESTRSPSGE